LEKKRATRKTGGGKPTAGGGHRRKSVGLKVVIVGAVAAGPKAGSRLKRLEPGAQVVMVDRDEIISYGGCGIPYYVGGDVAEAEGLLSTSFHMIRDKTFFKGAKGIDVLAGWEAVSLERGSKEVEIRELRTGRKQRLDYDRLILATGSSPVLPDIPGIGLEGVWPVADIHQAQAIKTSISKGGVARAAVVGAGPTGLEMAEALADLWGVEVDIYEMADQILPRFLDPEMARFAENHLREQEGIQLHLSTPVEEILAGPEGRVKAVRAGGMERETDLVILAVGTRPQDVLAREAGLEVDQRGGIKVNEFLQTSDPDIFAAGDCVANRCLITGGRICLTSGSVANRQGRVAGTNAATDRPGARFKGVVGSWIMKLFQVSAACAGLTTERAREAGFDPVSALVVQADRAHFYPGQELMYLKLIADRSTRRVLGVQGFGPAGDALAARIDAVAALLPSQPLVEDISNLELAYAPPFSSALDILNATANTVENVIEGRLESLSPGDFSRLLGESKSGSGEEAVFLDVRGLANVKPYLESLADKGWRHLPQETLAEKLDEVPKGKKLILICNSGARSYEAQITLKAAGYKDTVNLSGGVAAVKRWGEPIIPEAEEG
jgi:NADPH-dependent 2,4-dienoyl-CoA reductase/sulfur reductase-like enzyme/rhodanese-related sulfurtransferase